jgi:hypothetical protein
MRFKELYERDLKLESKISDLILDVANDFNDVTTSDLQDISLVKAVDIIKLIKPSYKKASDFELENKISDAILDVANEYADATTSDLQGLAQAKAMEIIKLVK